MAPVQSATAIKHVTLHISIHHQQLHNTYSSANAFVQ